MQTKLNDGAAHTARTSRRALAERHLLSRRREQQPWPTNCMQALPKCRAYGGQSESHTRRRSLDRIVRSANCGSWHVEMWFQAGVRRRRGDVGAKSELASRPLTRTAARRGAPLDDRRPKTDGRRFAATRASEEARGACASDSTARYTPPLTVRKSELPWSKLTYNTSAVITFCTSLFCVGVPRQKP